MARFVQVNRDWEAIAFGILPYARPAIGAGAAARHQVRLASETGSSPVL